MLTNTKMGKLWYIYILLCYKRTVKTNFTIWISMKEFQIYYWTKEPSHETIHAYESIYIRFLKATHCLRMNTKAIKLKWRVREQLSRNSGDDCVWKRWVPRSYDQSGRAEGFLRLLIIFIFLVWIVGTWLFTYHPLNYTFLLNKLGQEDHWSPSLMPAWQHGET